MMDKCAKPSKPVDASIVAATLTAPLLMHHIQKLKKSLKQEVDSQVGNINRICEWF